MSIVKGQNLNISRPIFWPLCPIDFIPNPEQLFLWLIISKNATNMFILDEFFCMKIENSICKYSPNQKHNYPRVPYNSSYAFNFDENIHPLPLSPSSPSRPPQAAAATATDY